MAEIWMHNGYLMVEGEKMSKSLGNFFTVHDLLELGVPGEAMRMVLLMTQYRQPLDWTAERLAEATAVLRKWHAMTAGGAPGEPPAKVVAALSDDLNTPRAFAELHRLAGQGDVAGLLAGARMLGLLEPGMGDWAMTTPMDDATAARIDALLDARTAARRARDFARADAIRAGLDAAGVVVMDSPDGATWRVAPGFDTAKLEALE
jgi:cysteinyl-tRNA synthetase